MANYTVVSYEKSFCGKFRVFEISCYTVFQFEFCFKNNLKTIKKTSDEHKKNCGGIF
jgi:hypothetical protein